MTPRPELLLPTCPGCGRPVRYGNCSACIPTANRLRCLGNAVVPQVAEHVAGILINRMEAA